jgi:type I restriction enzyme, R subunit
VQHACIPVDIGELQEEHLLAPKTGIRVEHDELRPVVEIQWMRAARVGGGGNQQFELFLGVMLAKAIARENLHDYKIVLVTDRVDLDDQIYKTFTHCDMEPYQAFSGRDLALQLSGPKSRVITTVIDKFENAVLKGNLRNESENVFVLVDESHRGQYGAMHGRMRKALPNACFIGFTGTPVKKKEKDTINKFGGLIQPTYSIRRAVEDNAVVPLLYEGRDVQQRLDKESIDRWFEIITANLTTKQKADLKRKFTTTDQLNKAEQKIREIALDISLHYRDNWQGTPYKAQLVAQDKSTALLYKKYLDEFGMVSSEVLISAPDDREGNEEVSEDNLPAVQQFWKKMMAKHGSEDQYNKNVITSFKSGDAPEIIIVVDKLITGFDAPRNTVLYLTRQLKDHTLLQAIGPCKSPLRRQRLRLHHRLSRRPPEPQQSV